jgi:hypothetical protein
MERAFILTKLEEGIPARDVTAAGCVAAADRTVDYLLKTYLTQHQMP